MQKIKTGLLSYGMSGKLFHAPFLQTHPGFELCAVTERSVKSEQIRSKGIKSYDTVDALFSDPQLELIIVNTPNVTHFEFAARAIGAGKHVLIEKPFCINTNEARALFDLARKAGTLIFPYQNRRYDSDYLGLKEVLTSGKTGLPVELHMRYDRYRYTIGPKAAKEHPVPGSGLLYDIGPHLLDQAIALFGKPLELTRTKGYFRPGTQVDDFAHLHLKFPEGLNVFITMSMLVADVQPAYVLHGTKGSFVKYRSDIQERQLLEGIRPDDPSFGKEIPGQEGVLTMIAENGERLQEKVPAQASNYLNLFEAVFQSIRNGKPYPVTEEQIIEQLQLLEV